MRELEELGFGYCIGGAGEELALLLDGVIVFGVCECRVSRVDVLRALRHAAYWHQRYRDFQRRESRAVVDKRIHDAVELSGEKRQARDMYDASTRAARGIGPGRTRTEEVA